MSGHSGPARQSAQADEAKMDTWRHQLLHRVAVPAYAVSPPRGTPRRIRLRQVEPGLFRWEMRPGDTAPWSRLSSTLLQQLRGLGPAAAGFTLHRAQVEALAAPLTPEERPVLSLLLKHSRGTFGYGDVAASASRHTAENPLAELLLNPALRHHVVDATGAPMSWAPQPLVWHFRRSLSRPGYVEPALGDSDGKPAATGYIAMAPSLYVSAMHLVRGPAALAGYDGTEAPPAFLEKTFAPAEFAAALRALGDIPPVPDRPEAPRLRLTPRMETEYNPGEAGRSDLARFKLTAYDEDGIPRLEWSGHDWHRLAVPPQARPGEPDVESLRRVSDYFRRCPGDRTPGGTAVELSVLSVPVLAGWLRQCPESLTAPLPASLQPLLQDLERAEVRATLDPVPGSADWFDLRLVAQVQDVTLTRSEIDRLVAARGAWTRLPGKGWRRAELAPEDTTLLQLEKIGLSAEALDGAPQRFHAAQLAGDKLEKFTDADVIAALRRRVDELAATPKPPLPTGLHAELRPYQHEGFHFLTHLSANGLGGILADDMGLGKTLQTLTWLMHLRESRAADAGPFRVLVVAPKSVVHNWVAEAGKFTPDLKVVVHDGRLTAKKRAAAHLVVVNYARLRSDDALFLGETWDAVVLDEGQHIKNPTAAVAKVAHGLKARHRLVLTGTPVENGLLDLWSLMRFAMPGLLGSLTSFKRHYDAKRDPKAAPRLAERIRPFLLRRTKKVVAKDLPERSEEDFIIEMEPEQRRLYDDELKLTRALLLGATSPGALNEVRFGILQSLLRMRQICCDPRLVFPATAESESAKLDALLELLGPILAEGRKLLVFSQFTTALDLIADRLRRERIGHLMLTGKTENRAELVARFQQPDTEKVFLLSLRAAGSGLTLTAASAVVLFDPWWNPAAENQAIDRTHRIGQKNPVVAYRFLAKDSIEQKIRVLQREKADLAGQILEESDPGKLFDLDTLREILGA